MRSSSLSQDAPLRLAVLVSPLRWPPLGAPAAPRSATPPPRGLSRVSSPLPVAPPLRAALRAALVGWPLPPVRPSRRRPGAPSPDGRPPFLTTRFAPSARAPPGPLAAAGAAAWPPPLVEASAAAAPAGSPGLRPHGGASPGAAAVPPWGVRSSCSCLPGPRSRGASGAAAPAAARPRVLRLVTRRSRRPRSEGRARALRSARPASFLFYQRASRKGQVPCSSGLHATRRPRR